MTFDLSFGSSYDPWVDPKNDMIEDSARCTVQQNTNDSRFWSTTVTDYYNKCDAADCSLTTLSTGVWRSGTYTATADTTNNWVVAVTDDDPQDRFCTAMAGVTTSGSSYTEDQLLKLENENYYECS